jgi:hypothetical protein
MNVVQRELTRAHALDIFTPTFGLEAYTYPKLYLIATNTDGKNYRLRFEVSNYDEIPPELRVVNSDDKPIMVAADHPTRNGGPFPNHAGSGLTQFICISGTRDFYTHSSHLSNSWLSDRPTNGLADVLQFVSLKFSKGEWK